MTEGKRSKRSKRTNGESGTEGNNGSVKEDCDGDSTLDVTDAGIPEKKTEKQDDNDDTEWSADVSEEAVRARMQDLTDGAKNMTINDDLERPEKERMDILYVFVKNKRDLGVLDKSQAHKEIVSEAERLEIKTKATLVLAELLFDQNILSQIKKHRVFLLRFTHNDKKAQKYLMGGLEQVIDLHKESLINKVPNIFKMLYDTDIIGEETFIEWSEKVSKKYVSKEVSQEIHNKAAPFIKWLQEADTEESESDGSEDLEIEYNDRVQSTAPMKSVIAATKPKPDDDEADDFDIDAI